VKRAPQDILYASAAHSPDFLRECGKLPSIRPIEPVPHKRLRFVIGVEWISVTKRHRTRKTFCSLAHARCRFDRFHFIDISAPNARQQNRKGICVETDCAVAKDSGNHGRGS
jgi:hypothetical protein